MGREGCSDGRAEMRVGGRKVDIERLVLCEGFRSRMQANVGVLSEKVVSNSITISI